MLVGRLLGCAMRLLTMLRLLTLLAKRVLRHDWAIIAVDVTLIVIVVVVVVAAVARCGRR